MRKTLRQLLTTLLLGLILCTDAYAWEQRSPLPLSLCQKHTASINFVSPDKQLLTPVCQEGFLTYFDATNHIPKISFYRLESTEAVGCFTRSNSFATNRYVQGSASPEDYVASGYDKGHLVPDGDLSYDAQVEKESFLMTNMAPQSPALNRGIWKALEEAIRSHTLLTKHAYVVVAGADYNAQDSTINNQVRVPHAYYKILLDLDTKEVQAWYFVHREPYYGLKGDLLAYRISLKSLYTTLGVTFKSPTPYNEVGLTTPLSTDQKLLNDTKKRLCYSK